MSITDHAGHSGRDLELIAGGATPPQAGTVTVRLPAELADQLRDGVDIGVERIRTSRSVVLDMDPGQRTAALARLAEPSGDSESKTAEDAMRAQAAIASAVRHAAADARRAASGALRPQRRATRPVPLEDLAGWLASCQQSLGATAAAHQTQLDIGPAERAGEIELRVSWVGLDGQARSQRMLLDRIERPDGLSDIIEAPWPKDISSWAQRTRVLQGARRARDAMAATRLTAERFEQSLSAPSDAGDDELAAALRRGHPGGGEVEACWEPCVQMGDAPGCVTVGYRSVDRPGDTPQLVAHRDFSDIAPEQLCMAVLGRNAIVAADPSGPRPAQLEWMWRKTLRNAPVPSWVRDDQAAVAIAKQLEPERLQPPERQRGISL